ncbi:MAG: ice-binding family protein [Nitrososphaerales archaeon]
MKNYKVGLVSILVSSLVIMIAFGVFLAPHSSATSAVNLGTAGNYVILAESGISTTGATSITGDIGVSPIASTAITGFALVLDGSGQFATSSLVAGKVYAADYSAPTPATLTTAVSNMQTAYTTANGETTTVPEGATALNGQTLTTGVYTWTNNLAITGGFTISGTSSDVWIFQIPGTLTVSNSVTVTLSGGATYNNIFWVVGGATTLGTNDNFQGIILDATSVAMNTGSTLTGRALAQTAVTLIANTVTAPAVSTVTTTTITTTTTSTVTSTATITQTVTAPTTTVTSTTTSIVTSTVTAPPTTVTSTSPPTTTTVTSTVTSTQTVTAPTTTTVTETSTATAPATTVTSTVTSPPTTSTVTSTATTTLTVTAPTTTTTVTSTATSTQTVTSPTTVTSTVTAPTITTTVTSTQTITTPTTTTVTSTATSTATAPTTTVTSTVTAPTTTVTSATTSTVTSTVTAPTTTVTSTVTAPTTTVTSTVTAPTTTVTSTVTAPTTTVTSTVTAPTTTVTSTATTTQTSTVTSPSPPTTTTVTTTASPITRTQTVTTTATAATSTTTATTTAPSACPTTQSPVSLTIKTQNANGTPLNGIDVLFNCYDGQTTTTGFSPVTFSVVPNMTHTVAVLDFGCYTFSHWADTGSALRYREFSITSATTLTAVYTNTCQSSTPSSSNISVSSVDLSNNPITGIYTTLWENGALSQSCFSPCSFTVDNGQTYEVAVADYGNHTFSHWTDGTTNRFHTVTVGNMSTSIALSAIYMVAPASGSLSGPMAQALSLQVFSSTGAGASLAGMVVEVAVILTALGSLFGVKLRRSRLRMNLT